jgi:hypothetical protein
MRLAAALVLLLTTSAVAAIALNTGEVAGEYQKRVIIEFNDLPKEPGMNTLKIVRLSERKVYVEAYLNFFNGHTCEFSKVMAVEGHDLLYQGPNGEGDPCEMRLRFEGGKIVFRDHDGQCRVDACGTRGRFDGMDFSISSRRPVRDMKRILASDAYRDALQERVN